MKATRHYTHVHYFFVVSRFARCNHGERSTRQLGLLILTLDHWRQMSAAQRTKLRTALSWACWPANDRWLETVSQITQAPQTTHGGMPACRLARNTMSSQKTAGGLVKLLSCPTLITRDAVAIAKQRTYRRVNSQKFDQRLTGNVIRKSINSVNYRLIESRLTSLVWISNRQSNNTWIFNWQWKMWEKILNKSPKVQLGVLCSTKSSAMWCA